MIFLLFFDFFYGVKYWGERLNFKHLLLLTRVQLRAALYRSWMFILCHAAKNEPRKRAQAFPLGTPSFAALQRATREITYAFLVLCLKFSQHERQAEKAKILS